MTDPRRLFGDDADVAKSAAVTPLSEPPAPAGSVTGRIALRDEITPALARAVDTLRAAGPRVLSVVYRPEVNDVLVVADEGPQTRQRMFGVPTRRLAALGVPPDRYVDLRHLFNRGVFTADELRAAFLDSDEYHPIEVTTHSDGAPRFVPGRRIVEPDPRD